LRGPPRTCGWKAYSNLEFPGLEDPVDERVVFVVLHRANLRKLPMAQRIFATDESSTISIRLTFPKISEFVANHIHKEVRRSTGAVRDEFNVKCVPAIEICRHLYMPTACMSGEWAACGVTLLTYFFLSCYGGYYLVGKGVLSQISTAADSEHF
jgi:hypothetical protein